MFKKKNEVKQEEVESVVTDEASEDVEEKGSIANTIVNVFLVFAIILAAVCTYVSFVSSSGNGVPSILGVRPFSIQTESMYPTLQPGDLVIATSVDPDDLKVDDIVTYWTVINGERVLNTHRITDIYDGGSHLIFATKGDNNTIADALTVHESEIVGLYRFRIPGVGKVFDFLQTSMGFFLIIVLPVFLFFIYHLVQFFKVLFEYQNIKNRIKYEQEREITEDLIEQQKRLSEENKKMDRAEYEKELREKLKAEILAEETKKREKEELEAKIREELKAEMLAEMKEKEEVFAEVIELEKEAVQSVEEPVLEAAEEKRDETVEVIEEAVEENTFVEETLEMTDTEATDSLEAHAEEVQEEIASSEEKETEVDETALREKMIEEELKKREAAMLEKLREELKAQLMAEMSEKKGAE